MSTFFVLSHFRFVKVKVNGKNCKGEIQPNDWDAFYKSKYVIFNCKHKKAKKFEAFFEFPSQALIQSLTQDANPNTGTLTSFSIHGREVVSKKKKKSATTSGYHYGFGVWICLICLFWI